MAAAPAADETGSRWSTCRRSGRDPSGSCDLWAARGRRPATWERRGAATTAPTKRTRWAKSWTPRWTLDAHRVAGCGEATTSAGRGCRFRREPPCCGGRRGTNDAKPPTTTADAQTSSEAPGRRRPTEGEAPAFRRCAFPFETQDWPLTSSEPPTIQDSKAWPR